MPLFPCKECGKEISVKAVTCPHCGAPVPYEAKNTEGMDHFYGKFLSANPAAICRKCRTSIKFSQSFCKTCGTYFPNHGSNRAFFGLLVFLCGFFLIVKLFASI